ncbi:hypothetical protein E2R68_05365 [Psychromonas sp. RZ22]|uniref:FimV/HubP family polar landmark protein n=1 Tax=Psychromonas algarum TaxID=2555643 RepID=UPI0010677617|nr:FimV/HubP family polar landmark protein [Psychromonas sp. RZ22]TEW55188.1 hypothetical protein E2R68_05365 [Psychromonas sp. RZ22]
MKRILLSLIFCSPLLLTIPVAHSTDFTASETTQSAAEQYGPTAPSETLWSISTKLRPNNSVSAYQTLVAIYKLNPNAFHKGDINRIIPHSMLTIPDLTFVSEQTNREAYYLLKPTKSGNVTAGSKSELSKAKQQKVTGSNSIDPKIIDELKKEIEHRDNTIANTELIISEQKDTLSSLNEELQLAKEQNQHLKLKLQPLTEQINQLKAEVEKEIQVQHELRFVTEQLRMQVETYVEPPFSGDGLVNKVMRTITSSISSLIFAIIFPLFILFIIFIGLLRRKSKSAADLEDNKIAKVSVQPKNEDAFVQTPYNTSIVEQPVTKNEVNDAINDENEQQVNLKDNQVIPSKDIVEDPSNVIDIKHEKTVDKKNEVVEIVEEVEFTPKNNVIDKKTITTQKENNEFINIETLLADTDKNSETTEDEFNLEFGLDEFPDVVQSFSEFDSDEDGIAAHLDLARAYLEMDEKDAASDILTALLSIAKDDKLKEVEKLLERITSDS